jgi:hypothetical protein
MSRGQLTNELEQLALCKYGIKLTTVALRMMPYVQYRLLNHSNLDPSHLSTDDRAVWKEWKEAGYVTGGISKRSLGCTKEFWNTMSDLIWHGYMDIEVDDENLSDQK